MLWYIYMYIYIYRFVSNHQTKNAQKFGSSMSDVSYLGLNSLVGRWVFAHRKSILKSLSASVRQYERNLKHQQKQKSWKEWVLTVGVDMLDNNYIYIYARNKYFYDNIFIYKYILKLSYVSKSKQLLWKKTHPCSMVLVTCIQFRSNEIRSIRRAINTDFPQCPKWSVRFKGSPYEWDNGWIYFPYLMMEGLKGNPSKSTELAHLPWAVFIMSSQLQCKNDPNCPSFICNKIIPLYPASPTRVNKLKQRCSIPLRDNLFKKWHRGSISTRVHRFVTPERSRFNHFQPRWDFDHHQLLVEKPPRQKIVDQARS